MPIIEAVALLAPWLATAPTAYAIGAAVHHQLGWPVVMAVVTGIGVETVGIAAAETTLSLWSWNRTKRKADPRAPLELGGFGFALYLVAVVVLTVVLENDWRLAVFPALSLVGVLTLALRIDQTRRRQEVEQEKNERKQTRAEHKQAQAQPKQTEAGLTCSVCGWQADNKKQLAGHIGGKHGKKAGTTPPPF